MSISTFLTATARLRRLRLTHCRATSAAAQIFVTGLSGKHLTLCVYDFCRLLTLEVLFTLLQRGGIYPPPVDNKENIMAKDNKQRPKTEKTSNALELELELKLGRVQLGTAMMQCPPPPRTPRLSSRV